MESVKSGSVRSGKRKPETYEKLNTRSVSYFVRVACPDYTGTPLGEAGISLAENIFWKFSLTIEGGFPIIRVICKVGLMGFRGGGSSIFSGTMSIMFFMAETGYKKTLSSGGGERGFWYG